MKTKSWSLLSQVDLYVLCVSMTIIISAPMQTLKTKKGYCNCSIGLTVAVLEGSVGNSSWLILAESADNNDILELDPQNGSAENNRYTAFENLIVPSFSTVKFINSLNCTVGYGGEKVKGFTFSGTQRMKRQHTHHYIQKEANQ